MTASNRRFPNRPRDEALDILRRLEPVLAHYHRTFGAGSPHTKPPPALADSKWQTYRHGRWM